MNLATEYDMYEYLKTINNEIGACKKKLIEICEANEQKIISENTVKFDLPFGTLLRFKLKNDRDMRATCTFVLPTEEGLNECYQFYWMFGDDVGNDTKMKKKNLMLNFAKTKKDKPKSKVYLSKSGTPQSSTFYSFSQKDRFKFGNSATSTFSNSNSNTSDNSNNSNTSTLTDLDKNISSSTHMPKSKFGSLPPTNRYHPYY